MCCRHALHVPAWGWHWGARAPCLAAPRAHRQAAPLPVLLCRRDLWDENVLEIRRVKPSSQPGRLHKHTEWCLHQYRSRFPRPLAAREYQYARRVWHRPSDGGCYVICRGLPLPDAGGRAGGGALGARSCGFCRTCPTKSGAAASCQRPCTSTMVLPMGLVPRDGVSTPRPAAAAPPAGDGYRAVRVTDIVSASLIRAVPGSAGAHTEMLSIYFEDSGVSLRCWLRFRC